MAGMAGIGGDDVRPRLLDVVLRTPPVPEIVPAGVFDAFAWSRPATLAWRTRAPLDSTLAITADNPPGMVFLIDKWTFVLPLPTELAQLHVSDLLRDGEADRRVLAPYAIDDATDLLPAAGAPPSSVLSLATASLSGLFWGLHDWAHFHHHGSFEQRAWTELQCDAAALAWLWTNDAVVMDLGGPIDLRALEDRVRELTAARFAEENLSTQTSGAAWTRVDHLLDGYRPATRSRFRSWGGRPGS